MLQSVQESNVSNELLFVLQKFPNILECSQYYMLYVNNIFECSCSTLTFKYFYILHGFLAFTSSNNICLTNRDALQDSYFEGYLSYLKSAISDTSYCDLISLGRCLIFILNTRSRFMQFILNAAYSRNFFETELKNLSGMF